MVGARGLDRARHAPNALQGYREARHDGASAVVVGGQMLGGDRHCNQVTPAAKEEEAAGCGEGFVDAQGLSLGRDVVYSGPFKRRLNASTNAPSWLISARRDWQAATLMSHPLLHVVTGRFQMSRCQWQGLVPINRSPVVTIEVPRDREEAARSSSPTGKRWATWVGEARGVNSRDLAVR